MIDFNFELEQLKKRFSKISKNIKMLRLHLLAEGLHVKNKIYLINLFNEIYLISNLKTIMQYSKSTWILSINFSSTCRQNQLEGGSKICYRCLGKAEGRFFVGIRKLKNSWLLCSLYNIDYIPIILINWNNSLINVLFTVWIINNVMSLHKLRICVTYWVT